MVVHFVKPDNSPIGDYPKTTISIAKLRQKIPNASGVLKEGTTFLAEDDNDVYTLEDGKTYIVMFEEKQGKNIFFQYFFNMQSICFTKSFKHSERKYFYVIWT